MESIILGWWGWGARYHFYSWLQRRSVSSRHMTPDHDYTAISPNDNWDWAPQGCLGGPKSLSRSQNQDAPGWSSGMPRVESDPYNPRSSSPNFFSVTQHGCSFPAPGTSVPEAYLRATRHWLIVRTEVTGC